MRIRRLGWAGVEIEQDGSRLAIDYISTLGFVEGFWGEEDQRDELVQLEAGTLDAALLTHLHRDHADPEGIATAIEDGGLVAGPERIRFNSPMQQFAIGQQEDELAELGIERRCLSAGESLEIGPFVATACESVDGIGATQVSWLISAGDESVLHCGDTLWHAHWWDIAAEHGSPDVVCLASNGVAIDYPFNQPAVDVPVVLTPEQAVDAAFALGAGRLMPTHFTRTYEHETMYRGIPDAEARLRAAASEREVELIFPAIGEWLEVSKAKALA